MQKIDLNKNAQYDILLGKGWPQSSLNSIREIKHLDVVHECWHPPLLELKAYQNLDKNVLKFHTLCLKVSGIKFQMKRGNSLFHLKFKNGTMNSQPKELRTVWNAPFEIPSLLSSFLQTKA